MSWEKVTWEYQDDKGKWNAIAEWEGLEEGLLKNVGKLEDYPMAGGVYTVDLKKMKQRNQATGKLRPIRRAVHGETVLWTSATRPVDRLIAMHLESKWEEKGGDGVFSVAFTAGGKSCVLKGKKGVFTLSINAGPPFAVRRVVSKKRERSDDSTEEEEPPPKRKLDDDPPPKRMIGGSGKVPTLAFVSLSTSIFMFDIHRAANVMVEAVRRFLHDHPESLRLKLMDRGEIEGKETETLKVVRKAWAAANRGKPDPRFEICEGDVTRSSATAIGNAANAKLSGGPNTGGVNRAIHVAAGPKLAAKTKEMYPGGAVCGKAYPVPLPKDTPLHGVQYVIHVVGPNMNPKRPNCLDGDYKVGCKLLDSCYRSLFESFHELCVAPRGDSA